MSDQVRDPALLPPEDVPAPARPRHGGAGADVAWVLGTFVVLGLVGGLVWWLLVDPAEFVKTRAGGAMGEVQLGRRFAADGWYVVIALVAGVLAGGALTWWRSRDYLLTSGLLVVGSVLAAAVSAGMGRVLGPGDPGPYLVAAAPGTRVPVQLEVSAHVAYLAWPIAVLFGSLMVLWAKPAETET